MVRFRAAWPLALVVALEGPSLARGVAVAPGRAANAKAKLVKVEDDSATNVDVVERALAMAINSKDDDWTQWLNNTALRPPWPQSTSVQSSARKSKGKRVAVLTSGTLKRFFLTQVAEGFVQPMVAEGHQVDYYMAFSSAEYGPWNPNVLDYQPKRGPGKDKFPEVRKMIKEKVENAGGRIRSLKLITDVKVDARDREFINEGSWNGKDHGRNARENMMKMSKPLRSLGEQMREVEVEEGAYDYVIILKDDAIWLKPFSLTGLLRRSMDRRRSLANPDGYVLKCDFNISTYSPASPGVTEYIFVLKSSKATPFFMMHKLLTHGRLAGTQDDSALDNYWGAVNFEAFAGRLAEAHGVRLQPTPPSLIPMQRGGRMEISGEVTTCLHKCCDSEAGADMGVEPLRPRLVYPACYGPLSGTWRSKDLEYQIF